MVDILIGKEGVIMIMPDRKAMNGQGKSDRVRERVQMKRLRAELGTSCGVVWHGVV